MTAKRIDGKAAAQAIRERTNELAVLKTLGFSDGRILRMVLSESCLISAIGGVFGLALAWALVQGGDPTHGMLPPFYLPPQDLVLGAGLVLLLGLGTGAIPAIQASRLRIVDALRRN